MTPRNHKRQRRTMRQELTLYITGLTVASAMAFTFAMEFYFFKGVDEAFGTALLMEARTFSQQYQQDPDTPLPRGAAVHTYIDNLDAAPPLYQQLIRLDDLSPGEFEDYLFEPHGQDEWHDSRLLIVYLHQLVDQRKLIVIGDYQANLLTEQEQQEFDSNFYQSLYLATGYLVIMLLALWLYNRRISHYTQQLATWAENLSLDSLQEPLPDFRFRELNSISEQLLLAFERIAGLLETEHQFLRHASHELRTPIAIIRANMELLQRVGIPQTLARPVERVDRASHSMQQLTETLLWLSRENDTAPTFSQVVTTDMLNEINDELIYLLNDKEVTISKQYPTDAVEQNLPVTPLRIVISNLLRNAYQYTESGHIDISVDRHRIVIHNQSNSDHRVNEDSFGLGLMLVKKITDKLAWRLELEWQTKGLKATLMLPEE